MVTRVMLASLSDRERNALGNELHQRADWHDKQMCFRISVRKALRERESEARKAIEAELRQMLTMKVWHGVLLGDLGQDQRKRILRVVVFLKDKYTASGVFDKFKARLCVNGSGQDHEMYTDVSSPTAATSAVLTVAAIAAHQGREVMTIDVGGAFLHADIKLSEHDPEVHVELDEIMTRFLLELDPSYERFRTKRGTVIVQLDRALYVVINTPPEFRPSPWVQVLMVEIHTRLTRINAHTESFVKRSDTTGSQPHILSILRFHSLGCPN